MLPTSPSPNSHYAQSCAVSALPNDHALGCNRHIITANANATNTTNTATNTTNANATIPFSFHVISVVNL
jgi:hypothetical protein